MEYKNTIFLPKTSFEMRANLPIKEPKILEEWDKEEIFKKLREKSKEREKFILQITDQALWMARKFHKQDTEGDIIFKDSKALFLISIFLSIFKVTFFVWILFKRFFVLSKATKLPLFKIPIRLHISSASCR